MALTATTAIAAPAPVRPVAPADHTPNDGTSFADLLDRSREAAHAPARDPGDAPDDGSRADDDAAAPPAHAARRAERAPAARPMQRRADAAPEPTDTETAAPADAAQADSPATPASPTDPALPPWLAMAQPPVTPPADPLPAGSATAVVATDAGVSATASLQPAATAAAPTTTAKPDDAPHARAEPNAAPAQPTLRIEADAAGDTSTPSSAPGERGPAPIVDGPIQTPAAPAPLAAPQRLSEPAPVAPPSATLAAPVESPEFAGALGVQVSVFARHGVQQAELQLNPVEMGPVSVQIALDGNQARVHFGAEVAATRHAIEASLPELAAALRDAGFTLSGGGVSQQRGGRGESDAQGGRAGVRRGLSAPGVQTVTPGTTTRRVAAGGVDLYA